MEKTVMGLVAAIGAAAPLAGAQASAVTTEAAHGALRVASIAELLEPVANAPAILAALDAAPQREAAPAKDAGVQLAWHHHHHHHHWYHHHHHHHYYYHHHHHHHYWHHHHHHCIWTPVGWVCP